MCIFLIAGGLCVSMSRNIEETNYFCNESSSAFEKMFLSNFLVFCGSSSKNPAENRSLFVTFTLQWLS